MHFAAILQGKMATEVFLCRDYSQIRSAGRRTPGVCKKYISLPKQLNQQMQKGTIGKYYLAVVTGRG